MQLPARLLRSVHRQPLVVTGTVRCALALRAVNEGDVVPDVAIDNAVLELCLLTADKLVGLADLQRGTAAIARVAQRLGVLLACRDVSGWWGVALVDAPEPDVVRTTIANDCNADRSCKAGLHYGTNKDEFGQHDRKHNERIH